MNYIFVHHIYTSSLFLVASWHFCWYHTTLLFLWLTAHLPMGQMKTEFLFSLILNVVLVKMHYLHTTHTVTLAPFQLPRLKNTLLCNVLIFLRKLRSSHSHTSDSTVSIWYFLVGLQECNWTYAQQSPRVSKTVSLSPDLGQPARLVLVSMLHLHLELSINKVHSSWVAQTCAF